MKEIYRKLILLGLVLFIVVGTIYTYQQGKKQDERFVADYQSYQLSLARMQDQNVDEAIEQLMKLHNRYPDQANLTRNLGLAYAIKGEMEKAALYYQKAVETRPFIVRDPMFSLQFAEILYAQEEYKGAKKYLENCKAIGVPEEFISRVDELLAYIETIK